MSSVIIHLAHDELSNSTGGSLYQLVSVPRDNVAYSLAVLTLEFSVICALVSGVYTRRLRRVLRLGGAVPGTWTQVLHAFCVVDRTLMKPLGSQEPRCHIVRGPYVCDYGLANRVGCLVSKHVCMRITYIDHRAGRRCSYCPRFSQTCGSGAHKRSRLHCRYHHCEHKPLCPIALV